MLQPTTSIGFPISFSAQKHEWACTQVQMPEILFFLPQFREKMPHFPLFSPAFQTEVRHFQNQNPFCGLGTIHHHHKMRHTTLPSPRNDRHNAPKQQPQYKKDTQKKSKRGKKEERTGHSMAFVVYLREIFGKDCPSSLCKRHENLPFLSTSDYLGCHLQHDAFVQEQIGNPR